MDISVFLSKNKGKEINQLKYSWTIGYSKENIMDLLTKSLLIKLVHNSLKRIDLQPLKMKKVDNYTPI